MSNISIQLPEASLVPAHNCYRICFVVELEQVVDQEGLITSIVIPFETHDDFQIGTRVCLNGIEFTAGVENDPCTNTFELTGDSETTYQNIFQVLINNFTDSNYFFAPIPSGMFVALIECGTNITVEFKNLNDQPDYSIAGDSNPLLIKEDYGVCVRLKNLSKPEEKPIEVLIPAKIGINCINKCFVDSVEICKDIQKYLAGTVSSKIPQCVNNGTPNAELLECMTGLLSICYAEYYGAQTFSENVIEQPVCYINAIADKCEDLAKYSPDDNPACQYTYMEDGFCVSKHQCVFTNLLIQGLWDLRAIITLYDCDGLILEQSLVEIESPAIAEGFNCTLASVETGLCAWSNEFNSNIEDVCEYEILFLNNGTTYSSVRYKVICFDCEEEFLFLTPLGTYESIVTKCFFDSTLQTAREYIELCEPCDNCEARKDIVTNYTAERFFSVRVDACETPERQYECFLTSNDVYWRRDGRLYPIRITSESYNDFRNCNSESFVVSFVVEAKKTLVC